PYPAYDRLRAGAPLSRDPASGLWLALDYDVVKRVLSDSDVFSSRYGPDWLIFADPPRHTKLRALVSKAFTPRLVAAPLPMLVIAEMLGIPAEDRPLFHRWAAAILAMSYTIGGPQDAVRAAQEGFAAVTAEMSSYLSTRLAARRGEPGGDLLTRLDGA